MGSTDLTCCMHVYMVTLFSNFKTTVLLVVLGFPGASPRLPCYAEVFLSAED